MMIVVVKCWWLWCWQ